MKGTKSTKKLIAGAVATCITVSGLTFTTAQAACPNQSIAKVAVKNWTFESIHNFLKSKGIVLNLNQGTTITVPQKQEVVAEKTEKPAEQKPAENKTEEQMPIVQASSEAQQVLKLVNIERAKNGLSALVLDEKLNSVAYAHSADMAKNSYFSHTSQNGMSPFDRMKSAGISYGYAGENIAVGQKTPEQVVSSWMNSEGHRANILNARFKKMGLGFYKSNSGYKYYWTQEFTD